MATHSSILAWRTPWTEEPGGLQYMKSNTIEATEHKHDYKLRKFIYVCNINGI